MAGNVISAARLSVNFRTMPRVRSELLARMNKGDAQLLDVRLQHEEEFILAHPPRAMNIPLARLKK